MECDNNYDEIMSSLALKRKLHSLGICSGVGPTGPTGPQGMGLQIKGSYDSMGELERIHPMGEEGDCYIVGSNLVVWDDSTNTWKEIIMPAGPAGEAATIEVGSTRTGDAGTEALVLDNAVSNHHVFDFVIPKGEKGDTGLKGEKGDRGPQGTKGEKGDQGPATIQIGNIETIEPTEEAEVINVGTPVDVVLDFKIPKGERGDKGDIGPRGLPGETGRTEHIAIDETETLEPGEPATVMDTFENWVHHLAFSIPKGEKGDAGERGPQGPAGPPGTEFVSSYGIRYSMTDTQLNLPQGADTIIPLPEKGPAFLTEYPDGNSIKIKENGVYLVSYLLCGATNEECSITMSVRANDILQPATSATSEFSAQMINNISGTTIVSLQPNDIITLNVKTSKTVTMKFNGSTNAMLSVTKIH